MPSKKVFVIVNPAAGGGLGRKMWPSVSKKLRKKLGNFKHEESTSIGHARILACDAAREGCDLIIAFGGDGTINEVMNGIFDAASGSQKPILGILCVGTGGDLIKTLRIPKNFNDQIRVVCGPKKRLIDVGHIEYTSRENKKESRIFVNITDAGLGAEVVRTLWRSSNLLGRKLAYLTTTIRSYLRWKPQKINVTLDQQAVETPDKSLFVVIANGQYFGGGMPIAPRADIEDGFFEIVMMGTMPLWKIPTALFLLYTKQIERLPGVTTHRARVVHLSSDENAPLDPVYLDIDGEPIGKLPAVIKILPKALEVKTL